MKLDEILRSVHRFTQDVIVITEAEPLTEPGPRIVFVNDAFERETGYSREEVLGKTPRMLQGPNTDTAASHRIGEALRSWSPVREEILNYRKDGSEFWSDLSIIPVADASGWYHYWVSVQRNVSEQRALHARLDRSTAMLQERNEQLEHAASHDALTGLLNRFGLTEWIARQTGADRSSYGVLHMDLDRFKNLNDTHGHDAGDAVLRKTGERIKAHLGPKDAAIRLGGDEFLLVRPECSADELSRLATGLIPDLSAPVQYEDRDCRFGVSIGGALGSPLELQIGNLINNADIALYQSKEKGRNRYSFFSSDMAERQIRQKSLSEDLSTAVDNGEFCVALMAQVEARTNRVTGYEALVRWDHPALGTLLPYEFLPLAEQLKLTGEIDRVVFHLTMDIQRSGWFRASGATNLSVNVSSRRLFDPTLMEDLHALDIPPGSLNFELLESILLDDMTGELAFTIDAIREMGIGLEIDDFGTGHASIKSLTQLQPDRLKLDRSVVAPIVESDRHRRVLKSILDISDALEIPAVAEGVETEAHARMLAELGAAYLQGFHIGMPQPAADIAARLEAEGKRRA